MREDLQKLMSLKPDIKVIIKKDRYIYDTKEMPHIAYDIDDLNEGDFMYVLIVDDRDLVKYGEL